MNKIKPIANDNKGQLVQKFGLLKKVLNLLRIVVIALLADLFNLTDLTSMCSSLNVFEMHFRIFTKVDDRSKIVVKA